MADISGLVVEPSNELFFKGPFNDIVTSFIKLENRNDFPLAFKVKTTAPKRYCVRPSGGILNGNDVLQVAVMLQPFDYDPTKKEKHKFMIQSLKVPAEFSEPQNNLEEMWKKVRSSEIRDKRLVCVHRFPGELLVEPSYTLTLEYPPSKLSSVSLTLSNNTSDRIFFQLDSPGDILSLTPNSGIAEPNSDTGVVASIKNTQFESKDNQHFVTLKSVVLGDEPQTETIQSDAAFILQLPIVITPAGTHSNDAPLIQPQVAPVVQAAVKSRESDYIEEIMRLKTENKALKETDFAYRRAALSETCVSQRGPVVAECGTAIGTIAGFPIILFLIVTLIIGVLLGKFAL